VNHNRRRNTIMITVRIRVPDTGEHLDDGTDQWDGTSLDALELSATDLGCEPGTTYVLELFDTESGRAIESLRTAAH
jgi:hypothetical protein